MKLFADPQLQGPIREEPASHAASRPSLASLRLPEASVVVPMATPIARSLRRWAAVGLSTIMLLEIGFHLRRHESPVAAGILLLLAVFVVLGRFRVEVSRARNAALAAMLKDRGRCFEEFRLEPPS